VAVRTAEEGNESREGDGESGGITQCFDGDVVVRRCSDL